MKQVKPFLASQIATELNDAEQILKVMEFQNRQSRSEKDTEGYLPFLYLKHRTAEFAGCEDR